MHKLVAIGGYPRGYCAVNRSDGARNAYKDAHIKQAVARQGIDVIDEKNADTIHQKRIYEAPHPYHNQTVLHVLHSPNTDYRAGIC